MGGKTCAPAGQQSDCDSYCGDMGFTRLLGVVGLLEFVGSDLWD